MQLLWLAVQFPSQTTGEHFTASHIAKHRRQARNESLLLTGNGISQTEQQVVRVAKIGPRWNSSLTTVAMKRSRIQP